MTDRNQQILVLIDRLSSSARVAQALSLDDTSRLLAMAVLDLQTKLHAISPDELQSFTRAVAHVVEFRAREASNDSTHVESGENVKNGQMPFRG
ncbi:MAG TPA: hypothetical protein VKC66_06115 [Xanthobacteraceae bacterium]|nr:hypothetical protein [Xanthobacteraceae bacterium]